MPVLCSLSYPRNAGRRLREGDMNALLEAESPNPGAQSSLAKHRKEGDGLRLPRGVQSATP